MNLEKIGGMLAENNEEARDYYKKAMVLFSQERDDKCLIYLDKAIELTPANEKLNSFRDTVVEFMETRKVMNQLQKNKLEMIKERERLKAKGIWK